MEIFKIISFALAFATFLTLVIGIILMSVDSKFNKKYSNRLMALRVALQIATIISIAFYIYLKNKA